MADLVRFDSPSKRWPGYIMVRSYLTFPALVKWEKAVSKVGDNQDLASTVENVLPFLLNFVNEWHLEGLPERITMDDFPGDPTLLNWLVTTVNDIFTSTTEIDEDLPKESSNTSDTTSPPQES